MMVLFDVLQYRLNLFVIGNLGVSTSMTFGCVYEFCIYVLIYTVSHFSYAPLIKCKISRKRNVIFLF